MAFQVGFIYQIYLKENPNIRYIGSSMNQRERARWEGHKSKFAKGNRSIAIYVYFQQYGIKAFKFQVLKRYEVVDQKHLLAYEQLYINKLRCVNKVSPVGYLKDIKQKQYHRDYYEKNREAISAKSRDYYEKNKEACNTKARDYKEKNKEACNAKARDYREKNKEAISAKSRDYYEKNREALNERQKKRNHFQTLAKELRAIEI